MRSSISIALFAVLVSACSQAIPQRPTFSQGSQSGATGEGDDSAADTQTGGASDQQTGTTDAGTASTGTDMQSLPAKLDPSVTAIAVKNDKGEAPQKGVPLKVTFSLKNAGSVEGEVKITPTLTSSRFTDFKDVPLAATTVKLAGGASQDVTIDVPVFLEDTAKKSRFALGRGSYQINAQLEYGQEKKALDKPSAFDIAKGKGVFALVIYDKRYFDVGAAKGADAEKWVIETMTRKGSIYYPKTNTKKVFQGGFDEMMGIKHIVKAVDGLDSSDAPGVDVFDRPEALATSWLNMSKKWEHGSGPGDNKHGYDYFIALDKDAFGGVTYGSAQVSGAGINGDFSKERMQILIVHESGHVFGAPHCDPVQGYVMCSGEKNDAYKADGEYVWYEDSYNSMKNIFE